MLCEQKVQYNHVNLEANIKEFIDYYIRYALLHKCDRSKNIQPSFYMMLISSYGSK